MALTPSEIAQIEALRRDWESNHAQDELMLRYYRGMQRVEQLGMAIPPNMRRFLVIVNWPRVVVDTIGNRQQVRSLILPGQETADPQLRAIWDASNMESALRMFNRDRMVYGRAFLSVGANEDNPTLPLIRVESPREMVARIDVRREVVTEAARFYGKGENGEAPTHVTLYQPNQTIWIERRDGRWYEVDRDVHGLGAVPIVCHLNRRMSGSWEGESQMSDIIPITDSAARNLTNLQFAIEAHGVPRKYMTGVEKGDFVDKDGNPLPQWEAYWDAVHMLTNPAGKIGQLPAAEVTNFETAMKIYGTQASTLTGFPARYFGLNTTNPPAEGAIRADEIQLVESVNAQNTEVGVTLGWVGALALRFSTGTWVEGNRVAVEWHDPATPTIAQREDALSKRRASGVLSREGYWDELGWSEARKDKERDYLEREALDPVTSQIINGLNDAAPAAPLG